LRTVAILGRPNVGKSTLFNRLVGRRQAIVDPTPGVTRDRLEGKGNLAGLQFRVIDTAGIEDPERDDDLKDRLRRQTMAGLAEADVGLFMVDARAGLTAADRDIADLLRRQREKPILLLANKAEGATALMQAQEAWGLGLGRRSRSRRARATASPTCSRRCCRSSRRRRTSRRPPPGPGRPSPRRPRTTRMRRWWRPRRKPARPAPPRTRRTMPRTGSGRCGWPSSAGRTSARARS
jgi:small GTP-binding protein